MRSVQAAEKEFGYKLPEAYVQMLRVQNGGTPKNTACRTASSTSWAEAHCAITGIFGIDPQMTYSLLSTSIKGTSGLRNGATRASVSTSAIAHQQGMT